MKTSMTDLREHLFDMIERIKDPEPEDSIEILIQKGRAVGQLAETIIDSARVENEYIANVAKLNNGGFSGDDVKRLPGWADERKLIGS